MVTVLLDSVDVSRVVNDRRGEVQAQFAFALRDRDVERCAVTWEHLSDPMIKFSLTMSDGRQLDAEITREDLLIGDRTIVPGAIRFVEEGPLRRAINEAMSSR